MLFNSTGFAVFFPVVFILYWLIRSKDLKFQNILLLVSSYFFYAWANWKILPVLILSTLIFYAAGLFIFRTDNQKIKNLYSIPGIIFGIAILIYFKYMNFFIESFHSLFEKFGIITNLYSLQIIIPVGISFYTFRLLSYVLDIQRGKYKPEKDLVVFASYVAFFPSILAGPIDRPDTLIPQIKGKRFFDYALAVEGLKQIVWGAFKKMVIADNLAPIVNQIFEQQETMPANSLFLGAIFYTFQIYCDFSGYTDMAIGVSKLLGFRITKNFNYPLFAQNIADFWRRWHISLTSWLTDYIFMPLNVKWRHWGKWGMILSIIITFVVCGLWHGANRTFIVWGFYHGLLFIPLILSGAMFKKTKITINKWRLPEFKVFVRMSLTFFLVMMGLVIFRADSISHAFSYITQMFSFSLFSLNFGEFDAGIMKVVISLLLILFLLIVEWLGRDRQFAVADFGVTWKRPFRWLAYATLLFLIGMYMQTAGTSFIYFQF